MSFLDDIIAHKLAEVAAAKSRVPEGALLSAARPARRGFHDALRRVQPAVIAEVKRASPSRGLIAPDLDLPALVRAYQAGGAAALSILTDGRFFGGALTDLSAAREAVSLPLLRKDFILDPYQAAEAAAAGADAILLIAACLERERLGDLLAAAGELALDALVEVHNEAELEIALALGAALIGVNNRDLRTFQTDPGVALRLLPLIPPDVTAVAESGIAGPAEASLFCRAGARALLVGEALVRSGDPAAAVQALREAV